MFLYCDFSVLQTTYNDVPGKELMWHRLLWVCNIAHMCSFKALVDFFHAEGERLPLKDLQNEDYKVGTSTRHQTFPEQLRCSWLIVDFLAVLPVMTTDKHAVEVPVE